jgi:AGZA family xanthine/uracil permease-like MFS transporter
LAKAIPGYATAPALFVVGVIMCSQIARINWDEIAEALPAMAVMIGIPLTYSIADGLSLAFLIHPLLLGIGGRWREVHWLGWFLAGLVILRYALL